ncbi:hypothetical protein PVNG_04608 [Plasmodium vivax North Korean]|nr:hypothetical protein PVNG_04608 [Plasmodium vivax North Korean]
MEEEEEETAVYPLKPEDFAKEDSQSTEWLTFIQGLEGDWERLEVSLNKARERWMEQRNKEWAGWLRLIENKWSEYSQISTKGKDPAGLRKREWSDEKWKKWFKAEVKSQIDSHLKKWMNDTHSNLFKILVKDMSQFENKKTKEWLMNHWKKNERGYGSESFEVMTTSKLLNVAKSREWYRANPNINRERRELMKWFLLKENEYLGQEWKKWTQWKKVKFFVFNSMCTTFSGKRLTKEEWNQFVNEIKV